MCATVRVSLAGRLHETSGCLSLEMLTPLPDAISTNDCNYIKFRGVNDFLEFLGHVHAFSVTSGDRGQGM